MNVPPVKRRIEQVKKDILAAITFLVTGLLLYLAQATNLPQKAASSAHGVEAVESALIEGTA